MRTYLNQTVFFTLVSCVASFNGCQNEQVVEPITNTTYGWDNSSKHDNHLVYQNALETFRKVNNIPGAVLLIDKPTKGVWMGASGYADLNTKTPLNVGNKFRIASATKTFIGTVVMQLNQEGRLTLEDKLTRYLPEMNGKIKSANQITIRQLLQHTSGIHDYQEDLAYRLDMFNNPYPTADKTTEQLLEDYVYGKRADFGPGAAWNYSNSNYLLLELLIRKLEQQTTQQVLQKRFFTPLAMADTYYEDRDDRQIVKGYRDLYDNGNLEETEQWDGTDDGQGDGGVVSTAYDLLQFSKALFSTRLTNSSTLQAMQTMIPAKHCPDFCTYGMALQEWTIGTNKKGRGHAGGAYGLRSWVFYFPEQDTHFILLTNKGNSPARKSMNELIDVMLK